MGQLAGVWVKPWSCAVPAWVLVTSRIRIWVECTPCIDPACSCSVWVFFSSILGNGREQQRLLQMVPWMIQCADPATQIKSLQQLTVPMSVARCISMEVFCFDWRFHSHVQDFLSFLMVWQLVLNSHQNREELSRSCQSPNQAMLLARGIKAKRVAHLNEKISIHIVSGQCVQDSSGYFLCVCIICTKQVAFFILLSSWESEKILAQMNLCCNISENTTKECLIVLWWWDLTK